MGCSVFIMRLDLFSENDSVLLLGEGNFSFSVCLHKKKLPIKIFATAYESSCEFDYQLENIKYLNSNNVPVYQNVDATKLHENPNFCHQKFSKIIFNFPHVGGKMKIHLNRELLKNIFISCSHILSKNGFVFISLCQGQGGTPYDEPQRNWNDSWQIVEMAAHGDFILTSVEPFLIENFKEYRCIGYRSQDVSFHQKGALVHIFVKRAPPYLYLNDAVLEERMNLVPLKFHENVFVPFIYAKLYENNVIDKLNSHIMFLKQFIEECFAETPVITLSDTEIPVHSENYAEVCCEMNTKPYALRSAPEDVFDELLNYFILNNLSNEIVFFPGMFFKKLGSDFSNDSPIQFYFFLIGKNLLKILDHFIKKLIDVFCEKNIWLLQKEGGMNGKFIYTRPAINLILENLETKTIFLTCSLHYLSYQDFHTEIAVINADALCQYFFKINWREMWTKESQVVICEKPSSKQISLYPSSYKFDVTLKYDKPYSEHDFYDIVWLTAGLLIEKVETVNEYQSTEGWSSKCYRLTYRSLEQPLYRRRVIEIHSKIVSRALEMYLNVKIS